MTLELRRCTLDHFGFWCPIVDFEVARGKGVGQTLKVLVSASLFQVSLDRLEEVVVCVLLVVVIEHRILVQVWFKRLGVFDFGVEDSLPLTVRQRVLKVIFYAVPILHEFFLSGVSKINEILEVCYVEELLGYPVSNEVF